MLLETNPVLSVNLDPLSESHSHQDQDQGQDQNWSPEKYESRRGEWSVDASIYLNSALEAISILELQRSQFMCVTCNGRKKDSSY